VKRGKRRASTFPFLTSSLDPKAVNPGGLGAAPRGVIPWAMRNRNHLIPFSVFGYWFSVKKTRIISKLKLKLVTLETELGIKTLFIQISVVKG
jgi:hypothetical protein